MENLREAYDIFVKMTNSREYSPISTNFEGHFLVRLICQSCKYVNLNFELFGELALTIADFDAKKQEKVESQISTGLKRGTSSVFNLDFSVYNSTTPTPQNRNFNRSETLFRNEIKAKKIDESENEKKEEEINQEPEIESGKKKKKKTEPIYLRNLIGHFFKPEKIEEYNCKSCKRKVTIEKRVSILKEPNVLMFSIKRFSFFPKVKKLKRDIRIETDYLSLKKYTEPGFECGSFELRSFIEHHGKIDDGHYVSYTKSLNEKDLWFLKNDEQIYKLIEHKEKFQASNRQVYCLFYQKD